MLGISKRELADTAGLPAAALNRNARANAAHTLSRLREVSEILHQITPWAGSLGQALAWDRAEPLPEFGDGAAVHGGRFNPKGKPALSLATALEGAVPEASLGFAFRFEPLTICTYDIGDMPLADLNDRAFLKEPGIAAEDLACAWFDDASQGRRPASWMIHERLHRDWAGILVPSFARMVRPDMQNIVLWRWDGVKQGTIAVFDSPRRQPRNRQSWE